jgi:hypothetical protein
MSILYPDFALEQPKNPKENHQKKQILNSLAQGSVLLGSNTKSASLNSPENSPQSLIDAGFEAEKKPSKKTPKKRAEGRLAGRVLRFSRRAVAADLLPKERVSKCMCRCVDSFVSVLVSYLQQGARAFYAGLQVCGSVWLCAVCAAKIMERRKQEVSAVFKDQQARGKKAVMVTLTIPHDRTDSAMACFDSIRKAHKALVSGNGWKNPMKKLGYSGLIKSLEVKWGKSNGFHVHLHVLWFLDESAKLGNDFKNFLIKRWIWAVKKTKFITQKQEKDMKTFSVDLHKDASSGDYLCKLGGEDSWGVEAELTKDAYKVKDFNGSEKDRHFTPFELLDLAETDPYAAAIFQEYAQASKGERRIYFSPGLKKLAGLQEKKDEQLAVEDREIADLLGRVTRDGFKRLVVKPKAHAHVLTLAETGGAAALAAYFGKDFKAEADYQLEREETTRESRSIQGAMAFCAESDRIRAFRLAQAVTTFKLAFPELRQPVQASEDDLHLFAQANEPPFLASH